ARHGIQARARRQFSDRLDRDWWTEARRIAPDACHSRGTAIKRMAGRAIARPLRSGRRFFHGRLCGRAGAARRIMEAPAGGRDGPNAVPGFTHRKLSWFVARALISFEET